MSREASRSDDFFSHEVEYPRRIRGLSAVTMAIGLLVSYPSMTSRVYDEIVDFIASGTNPQTVASFVPSPETKERVAELLHREKTTQLSEEESSELGHYLHIEHIMRLAKARARQHLAGE